MLNIDELKAVKTIVTHADCPDGIASALILQDVARAFGDPTLPDTKVVWVQYGTQAYLELQAEPGMLFCDMTPPAPRVKEFVDADAIVLDHHKGARAVVEAFGARGVFADEATEPGVSGAVLAYREVWAPITHSHYQHFSRRVLDFATLAGIRDTWQRQDPRWEEACAQAAALRFWPVEELLNGGLFYCLEHRLAIGPVLLQKDRERDNRSIAEALRWTVGGVRVVAFEGLHTSDIADRLAVEADLFLGWHYFSTPAGVRVQVSCRSKGPRSALSFARMHGGGGHENAAGFVSALLAHDPYQMLFRWVAEWV